jgi:O-antigen ligase
MSYQSMSRAADHPASGGLSRSAGTAVIAFMAGSIFILQYAEKISISSALSLLDILTGSILLSLIAMIILRWNVRIASFQVVYALFLVALLPAIFRTQPLSAAFSPFGKYLLFLLLTLAVASLIHSRRDVSRVCQALFVSSLVPVAYSLYEIFMGEGVIQKGFHMPTGGYHHPGIFAYSILFLVPASLYLMETEKNERRKILWMVVLFLLVTLIVLTFRRNVWGGLLFVLVFWNVLKKKWLPLAVIPLVIVLLFLFNQSFRTRLEDYFSLAQKMLSGESILVPQNDLLFSGRIGVIRANMEEYSAAPVSVNMFGGGFEQTVNNSQKHGIRIGGHNIYLILLIDSGLLGLILYMIFHIFLVFVALRLYLSPFRWVHAFGTMSLLYIGLFLLVGMGTHIAYNLIPGVFTYGIVSGLMVSVWGEDVKLRLASKYLCIKNLETNSLKR